VPAAKSVQKYFQSTGYNAYHDIQADNQHDLQTRKRKLELSINSHKEEIACDEQESKHRNPHGTGCLVPELNNDGRCDKFRRKSDHCTINLIPAIGERKGRVDEIFGMPNDRSTQGDKRTASYQQ
jgi:hypothetical protein